MAKSIAFRHFWMGDKTEMALDLESEGLMGYMISKRTNEHIINRDIRRAMIDYILKWSYGVTHRQSTSLKTFTASIEDEKGWEDHLIDSYPSAEENAYINQVVNIVRKKLKPKCRVVKMATYETVIRAMIDNGDPYLEGDASKEFRRIKMSKSTVAFMKRNIQHAFREALAA